MNAKWPKKFINEKIEQLDEVTFKSYFQGEFPRLEDGEPCWHRWCLKHISHPCEGCGRIAANTEMTRAYYER